ncbi:MAG: long-chain fatty acid--CoA ligase [Ignavibacteriae bacterium]|nr:long-chain fatty acid--CoA ligase [Ignavibacteriota bacterium]
MVASDFNHLGKMIDSSCHMFQSDIAVSNYHDRWTYGDLLYRSNVIFEELSEIDFLENETIICTIDNEGIDIAIFMAIWRRGCVAVPIHKNASQRTYDRILENTTARYLLSPPDRKLKFKVSSDECNGAYLLKTTHKIFITDEDLEGAALIVYTSGTTGEPKGVIQTHTTYLGKLRALASVIKPNPKMTTLQYLQLSFSFGQWTTFMTLCLGGHVMLKSKFDSSLFLQDVKGCDHIDWCPLVPSMLRLFLSNNNPENYHQEVIQYILVGGEIMPKLLGERILSLWKTTSIIDVYGLTESNSGDFIVKAEQYDRLKGTIGYPTPGVKFRITSNGKEVRGGVTGELELATEYRMKGYLRRQDLTEEIMNGGYMKTGDMGWLDTHGCVHLIGRKKILINVGGRKVSPLEVEEVYMKHDSINICLAGAIDDDLLGENIGLLIIPKRNETLTIDQLRQFGISILDHYKVPSSFKFVTELPVGKTGKADRSLIKDIFKIK